MVRHTPCLLAAVLLTVAWAGTSTAETGQPDGPSTARDRASADRVARGIADDALRALVEEVLERNPGLRGRFRQGAGRRAESAAGRLAARPDGGGDRLSRPAGNPGRAAAPHARLQPAVAVAAQARPAGGSRGSRGGRPGARRPGGPAASGHRSQAALPRAGVPRPVERDGRDLPGASHPARGGRPGPVRDRRGIDAGRAQAAGRDHARRAGARRSGPR